MPHPLVVQLRFARSEWLRALEGVEDADALQRVGPMNSIGWAIGHLAWQEQRYWLARGQGLTPLPHLNEQFAYGAPACTPALDEVWSDWRTVIAAADPWLDQLTTEGLQAPQEIPARSGTFRFTYGSLMLRTIYHYWYHLGEALAIRQVLGHTDSARLRRQHRRRGALPATLAPAAGGGAGEAAPPPRVLYMGTPYTERYRATIAPPLLEARYTLF